MNRRILRLAIPFIISNITVPLLGTIDTALMGHLGSAAHLGAIGLASSIFSFLYWNFSFLRMSMAGMAAQAYGSGNKQELTHLLFRSSLLAIGGAALLIIFQLPIAKLAFWLSKGDPEVEQYALEYFFIRIYAAPATIVMYSIIGWMIGMQNAKAPMLISIMINVVNIGLSAFFVIALEMKSQGVAWGTVIAQYAGLIMALVILRLRYGAYLRPAGISILFRGSAFVNFFRVNRDVFIRTFFVIFTLTFYNFASAQQGKTILGVNVIFLQLLYTFSFFIDGFANAAEALIGKYIGEYNRVSFRKAVRALFRWGAGLGFSFTLAYLILFEFLVKLFTKDAGILNLAGEFSIWIMLLPVVSFTAFVWDGIYLGATATREQRNATLFAAAVFFLIYFGLRESLGNHALLIGQLVFFALRGILQTVYYKGAIVERYFK